VEDPELLELVGNGKCGKMLTKYQVSGDKISGGAGVGAKALEGDPEGEKSVAA